MGRGLFSLMDPSDLFIYIFNLDEFMFIENLL